MVHVRELTPLDEQRWRELFSGYRSFYEEPDIPEVIETTWQWVIGREHGLECIVAVDDDDRPIAFAHLRWFARPSVAGFGLYLDDLFTDPEARGHGAGSAILREASRRAHARGASVVRWITDRDNARARRVYDAHAVATPWVTYDLNPQAQPQAASAPRYR